MDNDARRNAPPSIRPEVEPEARRACTSYWRWRKAKERVEAAGAVAGLLAVLSVSAAEPAKTPFSALYERGSLRFSNALLYTPARTNIDDPLFKFAPLIVQELSDPHASVSRQGDFFGCLSTTNGRVGVDLSRPVVYAQRNAIVLAGEPCTQTAYLWWYSAGPAAAGPTALPVQGVRVTVRTNGQPLLWETLLDPSGAAFVVASQALETAAKAQYGAPLHGRRFAVEGSLAVAPNTVVGRVIEDGPLELGPVCYLRAASRELATIICRCMPAQVTNIVATGYYDIVPLTNQSSAMLLEQVRSQAGFEPAWWVGDAQPSQRLERALRYAKPAGAPVAQGTR